MASSTISLPSQPPRVRFRTADEWLRGLGSVPLSRILFDPPPGTATAEDVIRLVEGSEKHVVELVGGTLVEKPVGLRESMIASNVIVALGNWAKPRGLGAVSGEAGMIRMLSGNVRMPDVAFFRRKDLPGELGPGEAAPRLAPLLAVEVLSKSNTDEEMRLKVLEYFESGVRCVWLINPGDRTLQSYDAPGAFRHYTVEQTFDGGDLLPGFSLAVGDLFKIW